MPIVLKSGSLNLLEPSGPVQACTGIALLLPFISSVLKLSRCISVTENYNCDSCCTYSHSPIFLHIRYAFSCSKHCHCCVDENAERVIWFAESKFVLNSAAHMEDFFLSAKRFDGGLTSSRKADMWRRAIHQTTVVVENVARVRVRLHWSHNRHNIANQHLSGRTSPDVCGCFESDMSLHTSAYERTSFSHSAYCT